MFPQAELIGFPNINFTFNSDYPYNPDDAPKITSILTTNNGTNQWWPNTTWPIYPIDSPTVLPGVIPLPIEPGEITIYPPDIYQIPIDPIDPDVEIIVLPKDPMKKRVALRELLKDKVEEPEEREGRRIDIGGEED